MRRRDFITVLGGAAAAWPLAARAQTKLPTIGFLIAGTPASHGAWFAALVQRMRQLGWIEGRTVAFEYRWAGTRNEHYTDIAAELVKLKVDVIVTHGVALPAAKQATSAIPIVFPVVNLGFPDGVSEVEEVQSAGRTLRLEVVKLEIRRAEDIEPSLESVKGHSDALYVVSDPLVNTNRVRINTLAVAARLPTMHGFREFVEAGGLMSYAANFPDLFRRAGDYVDKILRGAKPGDLPVEQPTKFDLVINLTTAKALGLTIPESVLLRADEVIE
jgi:putative ABC transport system substrate-binding protein